MFHVISRLLSFALFIAIFVVAATRYIAPRDELVPADAIVAISGGDTAARTKEAIRLYQEGWADTLVFSGAALDPLSPSNAQAMRSLAIKFNVPYEAVTVEESATNTSENAENTKSILAGRNYKRVILVTSGYHQKRAWLEFASALDEEVEVINHPIDETEWSYRWWWLNPRGWYLTLSELVKIPITILKNSLLL